MNHKKIQGIFDSVSKICAVMTAAAIVLSTIAANVLFLVTVFFSLASGNWRAKANLILRNPIAMVFLLFYALFIVGIFYTSAPWPDVLTTLRKYDKFPLAVFLLPLFVEERWRNYAINAFLGAALIMIVGACLRDFGWISFCAQNGAAEVFRRSIEFNFLAAFAGYLCLFKIVNDKQYRWLWIVFLLLIIYICLFRSMGRSGYVVFVALQGLFFVQKFYWRGLIMAVLGGTLLCGLAFYFSPVFNARVKEVSSNVKMYSQNDYTSVGGRITFVKNSIKLIKAYPVFGTGTGSFTREYASMIPAPIRLTSNPHNEYVYIAVQFGLIGLMILILVFGVPMWISEGLSDDSKYIIRGAVLGIAVGCLANSWLLDTVTGHFYVYFLALAGATFPIKKASGLK